MTLDDLNALDAASAERELLRCCGSTRWAREMAAARPFDSADAMVRASDQICASLDRDDWLQAFAAHPRIGESTDSAWATAEQSGSLGAPDDVRRRLATRNRVYEATFGYIFIVCATGKTADEMRSLLEQRLTNEECRELAVAADEQRKITNLRLAKLLT
jgi:OHCU decarboxylase